MARIIYTALVESIRGSIAGTTFQKNKYGYTVKKKPSLSRPWTARQGRSNRILGMAVRAWRNIGQSARDQWDAFALANPHYTKHNPTTQLNGYNLFIKYQSLRFLRQNVVQNNPEPTYPPFNPPIFSVVRFGDVLDINWQDEGQSALWILIISISPVVNQSVNFIGTKTKVVITVNNDALTVTVAPQYLALYGRLPAVGDRVGVAFSAYIATSGAVIDRSMQVVTVTSS